MAYTVNGNRVLRDGEFVAAVQPDGSLLVPEPENEKYRAQCTRALRTAGRIAADGRFVCLDAACPAPQTPDPADATVRADSSAVEENYQITTVAELRLALAALVPGGAPPPLSPSFGDDTQEFWEWALRHGAQYRALACRCKITCNPNYFKLEE